eukprot:gnl/MRDRNA2_/MRDRNA2_100302_c0_seq1.p1 gnl/MRDRNA2_/MRDRNA2_100302_c0~~gnl/MRDRNA2_/MRDRNA2_100302_c0_seq1.p1  ORF type:complete len:399 (-),score=96.92 gnl/MRDRNA2_/MRDRNA2_100302_c0_seq1:108-1304(-)
MMGRWLFTPLIFSVVCRPALAAALRRDANRIQMQQIWVEPGAPLPKELMSLIHEAAAAKRVRGGSRVVGNGNLSASLLSRGNASKSEIIEQLEPWHDHSYAVRSKSAPEHNQAIMKELSAAEWESTLRSFVGSTPTRFVFGKGNNDAQKYIIDDFKKSGLSVTTQEFQLTFEPFHSNAVNIIGELKGSTHPEQFVVLAAHYDSIPERGDAPGVDDNGSGVACLLTAARAMMKGNFKPKRSIRFVAFTAEEVGLKGSQEYVRSLSGTERENFKGAIIMDQVGFHKDRKQATSVIFETKGREKGQQMMVDTMAHATRNIPDLGSKATFQVNYAGWGSDHMSFLEAGLPAVLLIEQDNLYSADHWGHTANDNMNNIDFQFGANVAQIALASIGNLADPSDL